MVFLSSDGASVNSGFNSGVIRLLQEDYLYHLFVASVTALNFHWKIPCLSFLDPVDTSLTHLFYVYLNSSKKHRELKSLYMELRGQFEMYGSGVKSLKGSGTRWIDHNIRSMGGMIKKLWLYVEHLNSYVATTKNSTARATVEGKLRKFVDAKVLCEQRFSGMYWLKPNSSV